MSDFNDDFIDNDKLMKLLGKDYFKTFQQDSFDFNDMQSLLEIEKELNKKLPLVSANAKKIYKNLIGEDEGRTLKMYFAELCDNVSKELSARKYAKYKNMDVNQALNKNYTFDKCLTDKQKKKLESDMKQMQELTGLFENINKSLRKYALWCALFCIACPPAIFAMGGVLATIGLSLGGTEAVKQVGYWDVVKQLECDGKNPYNSYHYNTGYKKIAKLVEKEVSLEDIFKANKEVKNNPKNEKVKKNFDNAVKKYVEQKA